MQHLRSTRACITRACERRAQIQQRAAVNTGRRLHEGGARAYPFMANKKTGVEADQLTQCTDLQVRVASSGDTQSISEIIQKCLYINGRRARMNDGAPIYILEHRRARTRAIDAPSATRRWSGRRPIFSAYFTGTSCVSSATTGRFRAARTRTTASSRASSLWPEPPTYF